MNGSGGAIWNAGNAPSCSGSVGDEVAEEREDVLDLTQLEEHGAAVDVLHRVQPELERRHHPEVPAAAPQRPEQILVLALAGHHEASVGRDDVHGDEVVEREPETAGEVADAAAQGEARDAGGRDDPAGRCQSEGIGRGVEVAPRGSALGPGRRRGRVHAHATHPRQVDHDTVIARPEARHAVSATPDRQVELVLAGQVHRRHDIARVRGAHDHGGTAVDHGVVHGPGFVVALIVRRDHVATYLLAKLVDHGALHARPPSSVGFSLPSERTLGSCRVTERVRRTESSAACRSGRSSPGLAP